MHPTPNIQPTKIPVASNQCDTFLYTSIPAYPKAIRIPSRIIVPKNVAIRYVLKFNFSIPDPIETVKLGTIGSERRMNIVISSFQPFPKR